MRWAKIKNVGKIFKPTLQSANRVMPLVATAIFWTYLDRVVQILAVLVLSTLWLKYLGFDVDIARRLKKTKIGGWIHFIISQTSPVAKMNEEYFEETGKLLAEQTKQVARGVKKIEEEIQMSKLKKFREEALLFLTHNKKMFTVYLIVILFAIDLYFGISEKYGLPADVWYYVAALIMFLVLWAAGGEGWTGNTINKLRQEGINNKAATKAEVKKWRKALDKVTKDIDLILAQKVDGVIPPHLKTKYADLKQSKDLYTKKIDEFLSKLNEKEIPLK
jgi:hypothetical protein